MTRSVQEHGVLRTTRPDRLDSIPCGRRRDRSRPLTIGGRGVAAALRTAVW
jgi:hypothetical protein